MEKPCSDCGQTLPLSDYYSHPQMADGHLNKCKECVKRRINNQRLVDDGVREKDNRRSQTPGRKAYHKAYSDRTRKKYSVSVRASTIVKRALVKGVLRKAEHCEDCGAVAFLEASHHDYSQPLDVRWLCRRCHRREDAANPKIQ